MKTTRSKRAAPRSNIAAPAGRDVAGPRSLTRLLGLFAILAESGEGLTLAELSVALESPKSSLLNLLRPLVAEGYLIHSSGKYRAGPSMFRLCASVLASWNFPKLVRPFMEQLAARTRETVLLGMLNREAEVLTYVEIIDSPHPVRYQIPVGTTRPLYASSAGRVLLAYTEKKWREAYLSTVAFKAKIAARMSRVSLRRELEMIRRENVASSIDSYMVGLSAVAAPVFDADGRCVAALVLAGPTERFRDELDELKSTAREVAAKASGVIGGQILL